MGEAAYGLAEYAHLAVLRAVEAMSLNIYYCTRRLPSGTRAYVAAAEPGDEADEIDFQIGSGTGLTP